MKLIPLLASLGGVALGVFLAWLSHTVRESRRRDYVAKTLGFACAAAALMEMRMAGAFGTRDDVLRVCACFVGAHDVRFEDVEPTVVRIHVSVVWWRAAWLRAARWTLLGDSLRRYLPAYVQFTVLRHVTLVGRAKR